MFGAVDGLAVAGRTDAGVHALGNVVSVDVDGGPPAERAAEALNTVLPADVAVVAAEAASAGLPRPLLGALAQLPLPALPPARAEPVRGALELVVSAAARRRRPGSGRRRSLVGEHDFRAFTPAETQHEVFVRVVESAAWHERGDFLDFEITADSFLRHMVRTLVGTMLEREPDDARAPPRGPTAQRGGPDSAAARPLPRPRRLLRDTV